MTEADLLATTYTDTCTVYRPGKQELPSGETVFKAGLEGQMVYENIPCSLARPTGGKLQRQRPVINAEVDYTLFTRPEIDILLTDTVTVAQLGKTILVEAGRGSRYSSHNEYPANLVKGKT